MKLTLGGCGLSPCVVRTLRCEGDFRWLWTEPVSGQWDPEVQLQQLRWGDARAVQCSLHWLGSVSFL